MFVFLCECHTFIMTINTYEYEQEIPANTAENSNTTELLLYDITINRVVVYQGQFFSFVLLALIKVITSGMTIIVTIDTCI